MTKLEPYCVFVASKYFDSFSDYVNIILTSSKFKGLLSAFHYNPIPLDKKIRKHFDHLQTLHIYEKEYTISSTDISYDSNEFENDPKIIKRVIWYEVTYRESLREQIKGNECKHIHFTLDCKKVFKENIPPTVHSLERCCFGHILTLKSIIIPHSVTELSDSCFQFCTGLSDVSLSSNLYSSEGFTLINSCTSVLPCSLLYLFMSAIIA